MIRLGVLVAYFYAALSSGEPAGDLIGTIASASGPTLMAVIIFGALKEWWVPGPTHRRCLERLDSLMEAQLHNTDIQKRTVAVAETRLSLSEELARLTEVVKSQEEKA